MGVVEVAGRRRGWALLGVFVLAEVVWLAVSVAVLFAFGGTGGLSAGALVTLLLAPVGVAALVVLLGVAIVVDRDPGNGRVRRELGFRWNLRDFGIGLAIGVGGLLVTIPAAALWTQVVGEDTGSAVGEAFEGRQIGLPMAVVVLLAVWLVVPIGEEILFRGLLWRVMEHWRWNRWVILLATCVVFAVAHMELLRTPLLLIVSIPVGLARLATGNLLASIVAHQTNNFLPALGLFILVT
ncbi:lysostaphin resistance A-like protein [Actinosynnema sp. CA-248983]